MRALILTTRGLGAAVFLLILSAFTPLVNYAAGPGHADNQLHPAEAIVVLGGGIYADGSLSALSLRRVTTGIRLYRRQLAPLIVFSGPAARAPVAEAQVAADLARDFGVPAEHILMDDGGWTTREEARRISELLKRRGIRRILLVTDSDHLRRARPLFEDAGVATMPAPSDPFLSVIGSPEARLQLLRQVAMGFVARLYYALLRHL